MKRGRFCMSPLGTDVMGMVVRPVGAVARCVSVADTSLSLSLSLSTPGLAGKKPSSGASFGAHQDLLVGSRRALGCGSRRSGLGCPPHNPGEAIKGAWALVPSRAWFPGRRGSTDLGSRRPPIFEVLTCAPRRSPSFRSVQGGEGQAGQGRSERGVLCTRAIEDADRSSGIGQHRPSSYWGGGC
jgi:hypothetical protein